ncbi:DUF3846 domain-containing protein [Streptomyces anulatus]|uniref:DUF3846 domain-containing protein n=1 Tax=Streptomyces anulatus TaxID=1892 RepID=UPI002F9106C7|nr:DUF3846 domain-containing protein [Streptomyces anulatus]
MTDTQRFALALYADGTFQMIDWPTTRTLQTLYTEIGCQNVTAVDMTDDLTMWLDDEGLINGSPVNVGATALYAAHRPPHQLYHGTAIITGGTDRHGDTLPLTLDQLSTLLTLHLSLCDAKIPGQRSKQ